MGRQLCMWAIALLLTGALSAQAQEFVGTPPPAPISHGCNQSCHHHHDFSLSRLWSWMTYRPMRAPKGAEFRMLELTPAPPLYAYFIGEYGPRSPGLGYPVWDHFEHVSPEHCGH